MLSSGLVKSGKIETTNNPCWSVRCAAGTVCQVIKGNAVCVKTTCKSNEQCADHLACFAANGQSQRACNNPCMMIKCSLGYQCTASNHTGNCTKAPCTSNGDCPDNEACPEFVGEDEVSVCYNPCDRTLCSINTQCTVSNHEVNCNSTSTCETDKDCDQYHACFEANGQSPLACNDPCMKMRCNSETICTVENQIAYCKPRPV